MKISIKQTNEIIQQLFAIAINEYKSNFKE